MATPASASRAISAWTSAFAPTSIPRVGSSRMRTFGYVASQRAITTFCWFPPERAATRCSMCGVRMLSA